MNIWKQGRPVQPEQMGWCLLNALPKGDERCLKQRIVAAIGLEALGEEDGAEKVINELGELIRNPTFVRLVEWDYAWANLKQGAKTFDQLTEVVIILNILVDHCLWLFRFLFFRWHLNFK